MVDAGSAAAAGDVADGAPARLERVGFTALSHPEMLAATARAEALSTQWARQKRRVALQQRYGEDFLSDSLPDDVSLWQDSL